MAQVPQQTPAHVAQALAGEFDQLAQQFRQHAQQQQAQQQQAQAQQAGQQQTPAQPGQPQAQQAQQAQAQAGGGLPQWLVPLVLSVIQQVLAGIQGHGGQPQTNP
jgi:Sec-independent protein translocase protein TatA